MLKSTPIVSTISYPESPSLTLTHRKYEACSSNISAQIDQCADSDLGCACTLANRGFDCLIAYCPSQTQAICEASLALNGICGLVHLANSPHPTIFIK
jgi:hypothetical protein